MSCTSEYLYASQQEAHDDLMLLAGQVVQEIVRAGGKPPSFRQFDRDTKELWAVWKLFADPRGNHGSETGTRLDDR